MDKLCEEKQSAIPTVTFVREEGKNMLTSSGYYKRYGINHYGITRWQVKKNVILGNFL